MQSITQVLTVTIKELRELFSRPWQVFTLIMGPLILMVLFGIGSDASARPPSAIVVVPPGQQQNPLIRDYQRHFEHYLNVNDYTDNEGLALDQLRRNQVEAVVILPPAPFETIAEGQQATIHVLYNQIDPIWRLVVPNFTHVMAGEINRAIFIQTLGEQQAGLEQAAVGLDRIMELLDLAIEAADTWNEVELRRLLREANSQLDRLEEDLQRLGPATEPLQARVGLVRAYLRSAESQVNRLIERGLIVPEAGPLKDQLGLVESLERIQQLRVTLDRFAAIAPEVVIAPLAVDARNVARLEPDLVTFYAPSIVALLVQHIAVSMGALALVRERMSGVFDLYVVAPINNLHLLAGKYLAYLFFTLLIAASVVLLLINWLRVPLLGNPWHLALTLVMLACASVGLGLLLSLLASSERQAVQFSMLTLLGVVFFSGFTLPLTALLPPALAIAYLLPATYGIGLLQDVMLRGALRGPLFLSILSGIAVALFLSCLGLLHWRTRPR